MCNLPQHAGYFIWAGQALLLGGSGFSSTLGCFRPKLSIFQIPPTTNDPFGQCSKWLKTNTALCQFEVSSVLHKATLNYTLGLLLLLEEPGWSEISFASTSCFLHPAIHLQCFCSQAAIVFGFMCAGVKLTFQVLLDRGMYLRNFRSFLLVKQLSMCLKNREEPGVGLLCASQPLFCGV